MKGNPIKYLTQCGCILTSRNQLRRASRVQNTQHIVCAEHGEPLLKRVRGCVDCNQEYTLASHGPGSIRCDPCKIAERIRLTKKYNESLKRNRSNERAATADDVAKTAKWSMDPRGDFCSWMKSCISNKVLRCDGCRKFEGVFFGYDPGILKAV